eukprot:scaffold265847_cov17-Tisochrysis_lutea.AAC.1
MLQNAPRHILVGGSGLAWLQDELTPGAGIAAGVRAMPAICSRIYFGTLAKMERMCALRAKTA